MTASKNKNLRYLESNNSDRRRFLKATAAIGVAGPSAQPWAFNQPIPRRQNAEGFYVKPFEAVQRLTT